MQWSYNKNNIFVLLKHNSGGKLFMISLETYVTGCMAMLQHFSTITIFTLKNYSMTYLIMMYKEAAIVFYNRQGFVDF